MATPRHQWQFAESSKEDKTKVATSVLNNPSCCVNHVCIILRFCHTTLAHWWMQSMCLRCMFARFWHRTQHTAPHYCRKLWLHCHTQSHDEAVLLGLIHLLVHLSPLARLPRLWSLHGMCDSMHHVLSCMHLVCQSGSRYRHCDLVPTVFH